MDSDGFIKQTAVLFCWFCSLWGKTLTCGCLGRPPRCPLSCFSHFLRAHNKWPAAQAADTEDATNCIPNITLHEIITYCITSKLPRTWPNESSAFEMCHYVTRFPLTVDLKKRMTWAMSKFWSAHSMSPATCLQQTMFHPQLHCNISD